MKFNPYNMIFWKDEIDAYNTEVTITNNDRLEFVLNIIRFNLYGDPS